MKTPLETRGSRANDGRSARLGKKQPDGTHAQRIAHGPHIRRAPRGRALASREALAAVAGPLPRIAGEQRYHVRKSRRTRISARLAIPLDQRPQSPYSY